MVDVFNKVSFLELGQGNIMILREKKVCIPGAYLEEIKQTKALFLLSSGMDFFDIYQCAGCITEITGTSCLPGNRIYSHSSKIRMSLVTDPIATWEKKKSVYHIPYMKPAHAWSMSQAPGRQLHVLGVSGACSLLLTPSLSTAAPEVRLGSIFPSASLL